MSINIIIFFQNGFHVIWRALFGRFKFQGCNLLSHATVPFSRWLCHNGTSARVWMYCYSQTQVFSFQLFPGLYQIQSNCKFYFIFYVTFQRIVELYIERNSFVFLASYNLGISETRQTEKAST